MEKGCLMWVTALGPGYVCILHCGSPSNIH